MVKADERYKGRMGIKGEEGVQEEEGVKGCAK